MKFNIIRFFFFFVAFGLYIPEAQSTIRIDPAGEDLIIQGGPDVEVDFNPEFRVVSLTQPLYTTTINSFNPIYLVNPDEGFDGVADIFLSSPNSPISERCSGSLLSTGKHVLTAAHCLTNNQGRINISNAEVNFDIPSGRITFNVPSNQITLAPGWDGTLVNGNDLAILELDSRAPEEVDRYLIYRRSDEINQVAVKVGYGRSGTGNQGDILDTGVKRVGLNRYDADGSPRGEFFEGATTGILGYDFDNGRSRNDAFDYFFDLSNLGVGQQEVGGARGDSGSPTFIDGKIAGVTTFRETIFTIDENGSLVSSDRDFAINSSFGEFMYDNRISFYQVWIDEVTEIPENLSVVACLVGAGFIGVMKTGCITTNVVKGKV
ncbi:trypsin-like serine protease [Gloeocapsa sp. PCC 73106]|uniref:trypsin-like serine protease n=1 Tax=Gloeocapsa sp. PCC 73106 TaxID=102232 RepID=UPI0002AC8439|nr:trypsin-like serine protease [Gloeocapsa sp. PCC 73106]ELR98342.1 Trypsin [Gloeocapsa sp. PCC 73106]